MGRLPESYCADSVRTHERDRFLSSLFIPAQHRESLLALYALDAEWAHIHIAVTEAMIAQIRYAWWQEAIESILAGKPTREHPVLLALAPLLAAGQVDTASLFTLLESYREHFPVLPPVREESMEKISLHLIRAACPQAEEGWKKGHRAIRKHRERFGKRCNTLLYLKLFLH